MQWSGVYVWGTVALSGIYMCNVVAIFIQWHVTVWQSLCMVIGVASGFVYGIYIGIFTLYMHVSKFAYMA